MRVACHEVECDRLLPLDFDEAAALDPGERLGVGLEDLEEQPADFAAARDLRDRAVQQRTDAA